MKYVSKYWGTILHIYDFIYMENYYYFNVSNEQEYNQILKIRFKIDRPSNKADETDGGFNVYEHNGTEVCFIWSKGKDVSIIAHECMHAVGYVLRRKGIPFNADTDEAYAYLLQFLVKEIMSNKNKVKKNKC